MLQMIDSKRLSITHAAARLNVHVATVWRWIQHGVRGRRLRSVMVGGRRYIEVHELEAFLASGRDAEYVPVSTSKPTSAAAAELHRRGV